MSLTVSSFGERSSSTYSLPKMKILRARCSDSERLLAQGPVTWYMVCVEQRFIAETAAQLWLVRAARVVSALQTHLTPIGHGTSVRGIEEECMSVHCED